jgi:NAD+ synthase
VTQKLHISLAQINPIVGGLDYNFKKICNAWNDVPVNTDLVVFPEMAVCGYSPEDLIFKPSFLAAVRDTVRQLVEFSKIKNSAALIPTPWLIKNKIYNAVLLIDNGKIAAESVKHHLPNYGVFDEQRVFCAGPLPEPVQFRGFSLGLMLCEDMWLPGSAAHLKEKKAEILIVSNASPYETGKEKTRQAIAHERVRETGLPLIYVNQVGGQDNLVFDGDSFVMHNDGNLLLGGNKFIEENYNVIFEKNKSGILFSAVEHSPAPFGDTEEIYQALMLGLRDYVGKNSFPGVILGLSGGIDSALTAAIAVDALGPDAVLGVRLPSKFTSDDSLRDAEDLARALGIQMETISIKNPVDAIQDSLGDHIAGAIGTTFENIQPRARGIILMALSNANGKMLLSTGNKSETAVGYATLYGDMCGGFNVLGDVYKTQVYKLSNWRNENKPRGALGPNGIVIPRNTVTRAPTAELRENQLDQDSLPPYDILDAILMHLIEDDLGINDVVQKGFDRETILKVWHMIDRAEYKRHQGPPAIKITRRAFGRDRRYPITNHFGKTLK